MNTPDEQMLVDCISFNRKIVKRQRIIIVCLGFTAGATATFAIAVGLF